MEADHDHFRRETEKENEGEMARKRLSLEAENGKRPENAFRRSISESPQKSLISQLRSVVVRH